MSVYKITLEQIRLSSPWKCGKKVDATHPEGYWAIVQGPTEASASVSFAIDLPADAIIARAWIHAKAVSSPLGGIEYFRINGENVPASGEFDIDITVSDTSFAALFAFRSWGVVFSDESNHYGDLWIEPALYVDYVTTSSGGSGGDDTAGAASAAKDLRLPRLLGDDFREIARLNCTSLSMELNIDPLSTAEMVLPKGSPMVEVDAFVELYTPYGSAGIFRVAQTDETVGYSTSCSLRHGIITLADDLVTAGNAISAPVAQVFASLLAMQTNPLWVMGECEVEEDLEIVLERNYQTILAAYTDLTSKLPPEYMWDFDQTGVPWRANLRKMPEDDSCEFRMTRNVKSLVISTDRDTQCTRVYAFGAGEGDERIGLTGLIGTPYLDAEGADRVIAKSITNEDIYDALTLKDVAERYLERHKNPDVSVRVNGVDLYKLTGMTFDKFHMGKICRVPLPSSGRVVREKVVSIAWHDVIGSPSDVTATLATRLREASDELADLMREATNSKLIGGTVEESKTEYNNSNVTQSSSLVHEFDITGYGNALTVRVDYTPAGRCLLLVDSEKEVPANEAEDGSVDILRYLKSDENGVPIVGRHNVQFFAIGTATLSVHSEVTVKTIEKR